MIRETIFSRCRKYRYTLWRETGLNTLFNKCQHGYENCPVCSNVPSYQTKAQKYVMFIGLNPSTADETLDDPTIRRCVGYAKAWGYGAMCMTNLFGFRATDPEEMKKAIDPIGPDNFKWIGEIAIRADIIVAAWGTHGAYRGQGKSISGYMDHITEGKLMCLKITKEGHPSHPLYLPKKLEPILYATR